MFDQVHAELVVEYVPKRTALFPASARNRLLLESSAIPLGALKAALVPTPLAQAALHPVARTHGVLPLTVAAE